MALKRNTSAFGSRNAVKGYEADRTYPLNGAP